MACTILFLALLTWSRVQWQQVYMLTFPGAKLIIYKVKEYDLLPTELTFPRILEISYCQSLEMKFFYEFFHPTIFIQYNVISYGVYKNEEDTVLVLKILILRFIQKSYNTKEKMNLFLTSHST